MKQSAGTLLYRRSSRDGPWEVLLVHHSGNYNRNAPWSIPKGLPDPQESLEDAARRETREETGVQPGTLVPLGSIVYLKSRKQVHCFAGPAPNAADPRPCSWEVDRAEFLPIERAYELLHPDQRELLDRLQSHLLPTSAEEH
jgi:predicted NUDIX family NTP pyrophosphohydrolase